MTRDELADKLSGAEYGAPNTVDLGDGRAVRLRVEIDDSNPMNDDEDFNGKFAFVTGTRTHDYIGGHNPRPAGFTGNAEILRGRGDPIWWEPPTDITIKRGSPEWSNYRQEVMELLEYGYRGYVLELCEGKDFYGKPVVKDMRSVWHVEWNADGDYQRELIRDLLSEIGITED